MATNLNKDSFLNTGIAVGGDIQTDDDETIALGKGSVAANDSTVNAATAPFAVSNFGGEVNQAQGDGSQVVSRSDIGQQAFNSDGAVLGQGGSLSGINTGVNTGVNAGGDVDRTIVGDDNQQLAFDGNVSNSAFGLGDGDVSNTSGNLGFGSSFNSGGDSQSFIGNELGEGAALGGRDATTLSDDDVNLRFEENNVSNVKDSTNVNTAQDESSAFADQDFEPTRVDIQDSFKTFEDNDTATKVNVEDNFFDD